ncbi:DOMON-like domain-containing protein [Synechococcus sp. GFB01]|uniref:DOMON-like domain-containing protein n=1 Tax=Synechococcus sp. GFB01 TaxID=1662190 RepID=UPI00069E9F2E|nr:DOMON-like domain-containing protein [Synechococcus sp. GFB01]
MDPQPEAPEACQPFRLVPFVGGAGALPGPAPGDLAIGGRLAIRRSGGSAALLQLEFELCGLAGVRLPPAGERPRRRDGLWQHTCLEAFIGAVGQTPYWEVNLAPSGDWNVYRLSDYRQGLEVEPCFTELPFTVTRSGAAGLGLTLRLTCPLPRELAAAGALQVGVTAVIEAEDGGLSYWALHHPGPDADFHDRRGWLLRC